VNREIRRLGLALLVCFGALFLMMNYTQVVEANKLANSPSNPRVVTADYSKPRGDIVTSDGVVVARSVPTNDDLKYLRQYPEGQLFSQITGFDSFIYGVQLGVEETYNDQLVGKDLPIHNLSQLFSNHVSTGTLVLTISNKLQMAARAALAGRPASVVALDPRTGAVLAMYSNPTYDPNPLGDHNTGNERAAWTLYNLAKTQPMLARTFRRSYPPGSTFKLVTSAAVFDHDPSLATKYYPVTSQIKLPLTTSVLHNFNFETCGGQLPTLLEVSCDTGFGQVGLDLGAQSLSSEAAAFGFGQTPPIDLPAAAASTFPPASFFSQRTPLLAFSAIGQDDVSATPLQMALVGETMADNGTMMAPHVMSQIRDSQGNIVERYSAHAWLHPTSGATAQDVKAMMLLVTSPKGTAADLGTIPGVQVAAKTGTAQTGVGTTDDWMVAFAPADNPRVVVAVSVPNQPPSATGDLVAGPITRAVLTAALQGA
jgi:peptidoglycan glycosyltransferase